MNANLVGTDSIAFPFKTTLPLQVGSTEADHIQAELAESTILARAVIAGAAAPVPRAPGGRAAGLARRFLFLDFWRRSE